MGESFDTRAEKAGDPKRRPDAGAAPAIEDEAGAQGAGRRCMPGIALLRGVVCGLVVCALIAGGVWAALPAQGAATTDRLYDYVYSGVKSESVGFTTANMSDDGYLTFGTSELYISMPLVNQVPQKVFGESVSGVDMTFVGEAYDQSLWQAIAAGAYAGSAKNRKVVLMVSPQWFFKGNGSQSKFSSKFSYSLYRQFCDNPNLSDETRDYVRQRLGDLGIDDKTVAAANRDTAVDALNDVAYSLTNDLRIRSKLDQVVSISPKKSPVRTAGESTGEPDWTALLTEGLAQGESSTTTNDYGINDAYWEKNSQYNAERGQTFDQADEEYADLACFLEVCEESGLEPLVVMIPMHGQWYDREGVDADTRAQFYERVRAICDDAGVAYADFSSCEYEKYFLCDTVHPGWIGWVRIEHAFYDFVNGRDNAFLGGAGFGEAEGLAAAEMPETDADGGDRPDDAAEGE